MLSWNLWKLIREAPVTMACVVVCVVLFAATARPGQTEPQRREALHRWGAVVDLPFVKAVDTKTLFIERDLRGPISLWEGQWWRVPVCAFHHVDVWHLLINSLSAVFLGKLLERHWGSLRLLLFLPFSATIPMLAEFLVGNYVLGFSGVIAAMFGVLCVLRYRDDELFEELPDEAVHLGGAMLAIGVLVTVLDLVPVANLAHMTGFFYGALAGCVTTGLPWGVLPARLLRMAVVCCTVFGLWLVMHPVWDGTYHWYVALRTNNAERRLAELQRAVRLKPQAIGAWRHLAGEQLRRGETMAAWKTLLVGLSHNPSDQNLLATARGVWRKVVISPGRAAAEETIAEVFGNLAASWSELFRTEPFERGLPRIRIPTAVAEVDPVIEYPLNQKVDLALPDVEGLPVDLIPPEGDAVEGRTM